MKSRLLKEYIASWHEILISTTVNFLIRTTVRFLERSSDEGLTAQKKHEWTSLFPDMN